MRDSTARAQTKLTFIALTALLGASLYGALNLSADAQANPTQASAAQGFAWESEEAFYKIKINGSEAIHAVMRTGELSQLKGQPYVAIAASAQSVGLFNTILEVDDRANTFIDPTTLRPLRAEKRFKERLFGGEVKERTYRVDFKPQDYLAKVHKKSNQHPDRDYTRAMPNPAHDGLSWFFELRDKPDFEVGQKLSYYIYDGWKLSRLDLKVAKEEDIYTPLGWSKTWKFDITREVLNSSSVRKEGKYQEPKLSVMTPAVELGSMWLSQDERRLPVKIALTWKISQSSSLTGQVDVVLVKYKQHKAPRAALRPVKQPAKPAKTP